MFKRTFAFRSVNTFSKEFGKIFGKEREAFSPFDLTSRVYRELFDRRDRGKCKVCFLNQDLSEVFIYAHRNLLINND
jgi:hypothetical protein